MNSLSSDREETLDQLALLNLQEFFTSLGIGDFKHAKQVLTRILQPVSRWFAELLLEFDQEIEQFGLPVAAQHAIQKYIHELEVFGHEHIPSSGPLLILSNHPGLTDVLALTASINRPDLRVIAQERNFIHLLPEVTQRIIYVPAEVEQRLQMIREVIHHLLDGGAVLTFPAGRIEPDPIVMPGAIDSLSRWSESILLFAKKAPQTLVVPTVVGGVVTPNAMSHPLTHLRRLVHDQQRMGYTLQLLALVLRPSLWPVNPQIIYGQPLPAQALVESGTRDNAMETLRGCVRRIMENLSAGVTSMP